VELEEVVMVVLESPYVNGVAGTVNTGGGGGGQELTQQVLVVQVVQEL
jgi:hypothetical protein